MTQSIETIKSAIRRDATGRYNLTDLWKLAGSQQNQSIPQWARLPSTETFISAATRFLNVGKSHIIESRRGRGGGTWGHEQVFIEYAQYLDPRLAVLVNQAFLERVEEESNPELAVSRGNERASKVYKKQGQSDNWIAQRIVSITTRKAFTFTLASNGVEREGFRNCTNAIYTPLYGGTTAVVRLKKGLTAKQNIRDNMSLVELAAVMLSESLATEQIESTGAHGNAECELICNRSSRAVAQSIMSARLK